MWTLIPKLPKLALKIYRIFVIKRPAWARKCFVYKTISTSKRFVFVDFTAFNIKTFIVARKCPLSARSQLVDGQKHKPKIYN